MRAVDPFERANIAIRINTSRRKASRYFAWSQGDDVLQKMMFAPR